MRKLALQLVGESAGEGVGVGVGVGVGGCGKSLSRDNYHEQGVSGGEVKVCLSTHIHKHTHTYINTYIHTYIHT